MGRSAEQSSELIRTRGLRRSLAALLAVSLFAAPARAILECPANAIPPFASEAPTGRNFRQVMLVIHGWWGSCEKTFGENDGSIYSLFGERAFFDFDCFRYDTNDVSVRQSSQALLERLRLLKDLGYERALVVTHSTGGIVYLRAVTNLFLDENDALLPDQQIEENLDSIPTLAPALLWAAPIQGLTRWLGFLSHGTKLAWGQAVLDDLRTENAPFLTSLRHRLEVVESLLRKADGRVADEYRQLKFVFFDGQGDDNVVASIPEPPKWWSGARDQLVRTEQSHSGNVARSHDGRADYYPGQILTDKAKLDLKICPRQHELFGYSYDGDTLSPQVECRQSLVARAMVNYATQNFDSLDREKDELTEIVGQFLRDRYPRSPDVDQAFLVGLHDILSQSANLTSQEQKSFNRLCSGLFDTLHDHYDPPWPNWRTKGTEDRKHIGYASPDALNQMLSLIELLHDILTDQVGRSAFKNHSNPTPSIDATNELYLEMLLEFLRTGHAAVREKALSLIETGVARSQPGSIHQAKVVSVLRWHLNRDAAGSRERATIGRIYLMLLQRNDEDVVGELIRPTQSNGKFQPQWTVFADDELQGFLERLQVPAHDSGPLSEFLMEIIVRGGSSGNNRTLAAAAADKLCEALTTSSERIQAVERLNEIGSRAAYPATVEATKKALKALPEDAVSAIP